MNMMAAPNLSVVSETNLENRDGLILMTGLPITKGHLYLIDWAREYLDNFGTGFDTLHVLINTRDCEPIPREIRVKALEEECWKYGTSVKIYNYHGDVPQNPSEHPDFWNYWKKLISRTVPIDDISYLFASEKYGIDLAKVLDIEFIPVDMDRDVHHISGTEVRSDPVRFIEMVAPAMQSYFRRTITLFGAESCGKTTMTAYMAGIYFTTYLPEYARPYLETIGADITDEKMYAIERGQYISQIQSKNILDSALIFQDTDLLSTIGYWTLWKGENSVPKSLIRRFQETKSNFYIVMNDQIPFEPDPLRYGGDKRESDTKFWTNLLDKFDCRYYVVKSTDIYDQRVEIDKVINAYLDDEFKKIREFVRT